METLPHKERVHMAIQWQEENPTEKSCTAARIYQLNESAFRVALKRNKKRKGRVYSVVRGGRNKILSETHTASTLICLRLDFIYLVFTADATIRAGNVL